MRREGPSEQSLGMQSIPPHQALHSYPLMITHTHSLTSPKCLSKMSLRNLFHANYGSSSFSVPFMLSFFQPCFCLFLYLCSLSSSSLSLSLSLFYLNASFCLLSSFHFAQRLFSFPQVLLEHTFTDKSIICVQLKHTQYKTGIEDWTNTSRICNRMLEMSLLLFANLNSVYLLSFKNVGLKGKANTETKMCSSWFKMCFKETWMAA